MNETYEEAQERISNQRAVNLMNAHEQIENLKRAARLIHERRAMISGSKEMADCDAFCKSVGLEVWTWPIRKK